MLSPVSSPSTQKAPSQETRALTVAFLLLCFGFIAVLYHYAWLGSYLGQGWPQASLGELPQIFANDLTRLLALSDGFNPYAQMRTHVPLEAVPYPPFALLLYGALAKLGTFGAFVLFYGAIFIGIALLIQRQLREASCITRAFATLGCLFGAFPMLYLFDRGNLDGWALIAAWAGVWLATQTPKTETAAKPQNLLSGSVWLIAIAGSLKIYPIIYALIFVMRRQYGRLIACLALAAVLNLAAAALLEGGIVATLQGFLRELAMATNCYADAASCPSYSFLYALKTLLTKMHVPFAAYGEWLKPMHIFLTLVMVFGAGVLLARKEIPVADGMLWAGLIGLWVPTMSFGYKPVFFLIPLFFYLQSDDRRAFLMAILLTLVLLSKRVAETVMGQPTLLNQALLLFALFLSLAPLFPHHPLTKTLAKLPIDGMRLASMATVAFLALYGFAAYKQTALPAYGAGENHLTLTASDAPGHYATGWGPFESDGQSHWRWMQGCEAKMNVWLVPMHDYTVTLITQNHAGNPSQNLQMLFNNRVIGTAAYQPGEVKVLTFSIPQDAMASTKIVPDRLTFRTAECNPPDPNGSQGLGVSLAALSFSQKAR